MNRTFSNHTTLQRFQVGPFQVKQPLPASGLEQVSPFILLHHAGPTEHAPGEIKARLSPHPHRGFEPVTFLFSGSLHHKDSLGSEGYLESGDVQWMTAGSGIIHSEGPSEAFARAGGKMELVQLWVNLPRAYKMTPPKYQDIKKDAMPLIRQGGFSFRLVAGELAGERGPASTFSPLLALMAYFEAGAETVIPIPRSFNALVYLLEGDLESGGIPIESHNLAVFHSDGDAIHLKAGRGGKLLLLAGEPLQEPMVSHGPFVMNYPGEIKQAILDFQSGKMGTLEQ